MSENRKLRELFEKIDEHILAVKGTLELLDASVSEDDLRKLILKAVDRMESMHVLSEELFSALSRVFDQMEAEKRGKSDSTG